MTQHMSDIKIKYEVVELFPLNKEILAPNFSDEVLTFEFSKNVKITKFYVKISLNPVKLKNHILNDNIVDLLHHQYEYGSENDMLFWFKKDLGLELLKSATLFYDGKIMHITNNDIITKNMASISSQQERGFDIMIGNDNKLTKPITCLNGMFTLKYDMYVPLIFQKKELNFEILDNGKLTIHINYIKHLCRLHNLTFDMLEPIIIRDISLLVHIVEFY